MGKKKCYGLLILVEIGLETALSGHLTGELNRSYDTEGNQFNLGETCLSLFSE